MRYATLTEAGESYLCIDARELEEIDLPDLARQLFTRHDAAHCLLVTRSNKSDGTLLLLNRPCLAQSFHGQGLCGVARFLAGSAGHWRQTLEHAGTMWTVEGDGHVSRIHVGKPTVQPPVEMPLTFPDTVYNVTRVELRGEPHAVVFVHDLPDSLVEEVGPQIEAHPCFSRRPHVVFAKMKHRDEATARLWLRERGSWPGYSSALAAIVVAGAMTGKSGRKVLLHLPGGGQATVDWSSPLDEQVYLHGTSNQAHTGEWPTS